MLVDPDVPFDGVLRKLGTGLYEVLSLWSVRDIFRDWIEFDFQLPEFQGDVDARLEALGKMFAEGTYVHPYGSCDSPEQFMTHPECGLLLLRLPHKYCVTFTYESKVSAPGRRWHKHGPHFGAEEPQCEELGQEPVIQAIHSYHIYRKRD